MVHRSTLTRLTLGLTALGAGCVLRDEFPKVSEAENACPGIAPVGQLTSDACIACIADKCCREVVPCLADDGCRAGLDQPIHPGAELPREADQPLACVQRECDAACNVSYGCEGTAYAASLPRDGDKLTARFHFSDYVEEGNPIRASLAVEACNPLTRTCDAPSDGAALTDEQGDVTFSFRAKEATQYISADPNYDPANANPEDGEHYPPHASAWSEPVPVLGGVAWDQAFSSKAVGLLLQLASAKLSTVLPFSADDAHIVFYVHNCMPLRYLYAQEADVPSGGAEGAEIVLTPEGGEPLDPARILYRGVASLLAPQTSAAGSGGTAIVKSGGYSASVDFETPDGVAHSMKVEKFIVPKGGIGVVHLFPSSR